MAKYTATARADVKERQKARENFKPKEKPENPFNQWVAAYHDDPVAFAEDMLGVTLFEYQQEPLRAMARGERKIAVRSGHGTGKSTIAAIGALWYLLTRYPVRIVMTAPTIAQLDGVLFGAIRAYTLLLPLPLQNLLEVQRERIFLRASPDEAWAAARTARAESPEALAGVHAENVLLIADEASGIAETIFEHSIGSMSGENAHTLLLSNPTRRNGFFYRVFNDARAGADWSKFLFSCLDSPLVSEEFVEEVKAQYGEDSNAFRVRVLGEFPLQDVDAMFNGPLVRDAMERDIQGDPYAPCVIGVDVARMGADRSALVVRREKVIEDIRFWAKAELMDTTGRVVSYIRDMPPEQRPQEVCVDAIGMGAGVADRLTEIFDQYGWDITVISVNVAEAATVDDRAHRLKDELLLKFRDWLEMKDCSLPNMTETYDDIVAIGYKFSSAGKMQAESKDDLRRRGVKSTDILDAMSIFKGQGKSGVTAPTTRRTVEKNFNKSGVNSKMTTRNITENGRIPDGSTQMGSAAPSYAPSPASLPAYNGRPKQ
jgi:hypothetical protein